MGDKPDDEKLEEFREKLGPLECLRLIAGASDKLQAASAHVFVQFPVTATSQILLVRAGDTVEAVRQVGLCHGLVMAPATEPCGGLQGYRDQRGRFYLYERNQLEAGHRHQKASMRASNMDGGMR